MTHFIQEYRIFFTRVAGILVVLFYLFTGPAEHWNLFTDMTVDVFAFVLVLVATFGRLWALAYISGNKTARLVTKGPYSIVRNPLYLFSFIGIIGIGLASKNIVMLSALCTLFGLYYPFVILAEERKLAKAHGDAFERYRSSTPIFFPRFSLYRDRPDCTIDTRSFRRSFFSVMWFPLVYLFLLLFERLHESSLL